MALAACGGGGGTQGGPPQEVTPITDVRFDLSGAVGLQLGTPTGLSASSVTSGLVKILSSGLTEDTLAEGAVRVTDFFLRNGNVYVLLDPGTSTCVLGEIDATGELSCVDDALAEIDLRTIQFDANGGIFYAGSLEDGRRVIRRSFEGTLTDYLVARDATTIGRFVATRDGNVIAQGRTTGSLGDADWIRVIEPTGRTTTVSGSALGFYLPDGTLLYYGDDGVMRYFVHDGVVPDPRPYCSDYVPRDESARFQLPVDVPGPCGALSGSIFLAYDEANYLQFRDQGPWDRLSISSDAVIYADATGLFRVYPTMARIDLPITDLNNAVLRGQLAAVSGYDESAEPRAYVVDLRDERVMDILGPRRIDVLRLTLELDRQRVLLYGLDLDRNQPVIGEYDLAGLGGLQVADIDQELASSFQPLDWTANHVPPEVRFRAPEPAFTATALTGWDAGLARFDATGMPGLAWIDRATWSFGDGTTVEGDSWDGGMEAVHGYAAPGTYPVTLTVEDQFGETASFTDSVTIAETRTILDLDGDGNMAIAIDDEGAVWTWGQGPLGDGTLGPREAPTRITMPTTARIVNVASGFAVLALDEDGQAWSWGSNTSRVLGIGIGDGRMTPGPVTMPPEVRFTALDSGWNGIALDETGRVWWWGIWSGGTPIPLDAPTDVTFTAVVAGPSSYALASDGRVWAWGDNSRGQLGDGTFTSRNTDPAPVLLPDGVRIERLIATGDQAVLAIDDQGQLWVWGSNQYDENGGTTANDVEPVPVLVTTLPNGVRHLAVASGRVFVIDTNGGGWWWGGGNPSTPMQFEVLPSVGIDLFESHIGSGPGAVDQYGHVWSWQIDYFPPTATPNRVTAFEAAP